MLSAIGRRLATAAITLALVTTIVFGLLSALPGDPAGEENAPRPLPPEYRAALRAQYHLDEPWPLRYQRWVSELLRGDLGTSFLNGRPVTDLLQERLPISVRLNALALAAMVAIALTLGVVGAWKPHGPWDRASWIVTTALYAAPVFWTALLLQWLFAIRLGWLPLSGVRADEVQPTSFLGVVWDGARHLLLPAACLATGGIAYVSRFVRASVLANTSGDGGRAARARGLSTLQYIVRHGLVQALAPLLTLAGFLIPRLLSGSLLVEQIFGVPGVGSLLFQAILSRDLPVVLALTLISGLLTLAGTTMADVLIVCLDPRSRHAA